jgi:hypothetical protein
MVLGIEFGEKLLYKVKIKDKLEKINTRWEFGIFVGVRRRSGELWVAVTDSRGGEVEQRLCVPSDGESI